MNKKIIALAVAAAFSSPAFADVTPYGIIDAAVTRISASGQKSDLVVVSGGASTSRLGVKVTEAVDNLTVVGVLEYGLDSANSDGLSTTTARQKMLAVAGGFGTVAAGHLQTTGYDFAGKFDPISGSLVSPLQSVTKGGGFYIGSIAGAARAQRALAYISPDMSGFTVAVNYSTALSGLGNLGSATDVKTSAYLLSGTYAAGPLAAGLVYLKASTPVSANDPTEWALGGSYDLGAAKLMGTYQRNKVAVSNNAYSLAAVMPVGTDAVALTYAASKMAAANTNGSQWTLGYLHTMSKTTTAYAGVSRGSNDSATNAYSVGNNAVAGGTLTKGGSSTLIAVGLRKKF